MRGPRGRVRVDWSKSHEAGVLPRVKGEAVCPWKNVLSLGSEPRILLLPRMAGFSVFPSLLRALLVVLACLYGAMGDDGKVIVTYWEKWTGFEEEAMRQIVADFNASQDRIHVEFSSVSQIDRRLMLATAGGVPPDVAGVWPGNIPVYAENNALTPLDRLAREAGISGSDYLPIIWEMCRFRGRLWALPSTPSSNALIYNKKLFREGGLDPEKPPRSIAELEEFNEKLTRRGEGGRIEVLGHSPQEPGWWSAMWGYWFGANMTIGDSKVTPDSTENLAAMRWIESYPKRFGSDNLMTLRDGFGNFASPQNPFFTGRVAMILQGVWIYNYIQNYAPADFEWGVAAFPSDDPERLQGVTLVDCDLLVIPAGAKHPREAFEFMRYVNSPGPMEKLCLLQKKFSPLRECSEEFFAMHPNPFIRKFLDLAKGPGARSIPYIASWNEYQREMRNAVDRVWSGGATPEEALADVRVRQQKRLDRQHQRWERNAPVLERIWDSQ